MSTLLLTGAGPSASTVVLTNLSTNPSVEMDLSGWTNTTTVRTNLVQNPSFETDVTTNVVTTGGYNLNAGATVTQQTGGVNGTKCLQQVSSSANQGIALPLDGITSNVALAVTFRAKGLSGGETIDVFFGDFGSGHFTSTSLKTLTTSWQEFTFSATAGNWNSSFSGQVAVVIRNKSAETVQIDSVCVVAGTTVPAYSDGSSTGGAWTGTANLSSSTVSMAFTRSNAWSSAGTWSARWAGTMPIVGDTLDSPSFLVTAGVTYGIRLTYNAATISTGNVGVTIHWSDGTSSSALATISATGSADITGTATVAAGVTAGTIRATPSTAGTFDISFDAMIVAASATAPAYFDGNTTGCHWTGTANLSTSVNTP